MDKPAVTAFKASEEEAKKQRINKIMDDAAKALETEGVQYLIGVVDRQPQSPDGGKVYIQNDLKGEDFTIILDAALPNRQDVVNLGIWVGQLLTDRTKKK